MSSPRSRSQSNRLQASLDFERHDAARNRPVAQAGFTQTARVEHRNHDRSNKHRGDQRDLSLKVGTTGSLTILAFDVHSTSCQIWLRSKAE